MEKKMLIWFRNHNPFNRMIPSFFNFFFYFLFFYVRYFFIFYTYKPATDKSIVNERTGEKSASTDNFLYDRRVYKVTETSTLSKKIYIIKNPK